MTNCIPLGVAALAVALVAPLPAQSSRSVPAAAWDSFTRTFDAFAVGDSIVGASVLMVRDGRTVAHHEFGFADRAAGQRTSPATIFHWASITKTLTAIAIMQLRDHGRLALNDAATRYVPELRLVHDPYGPIDAVTLRMLLSHSAGFQDPTWPYGEGRQWEPFEPTRWEQLVAMMPYQQLGFAPGSRFSYSNPAFIYLGRTIEQLTGDPYEAYIQKNLWTPLGMMYSYFGVTPYHLAPLRSNNYTVLADSGGQERVVANGRDFDPGITIPNGGWNAPLSDLAVYLAFLTDEPRADSTLRRRYALVLSRGSLSEMWRPALLAADPGAPADSMGLSFFVLHRGPRVFVGHTGRQAGFRSFFYLDRASGAAVVAAFNTANSAHPDASERGFVAVRETALRLLSSAADWPTR